MNKIDEFNEYSKSNYMYQTREKYLVYEIITEETDNVEFADFYKCAQLLIHSNKYLENTKLPEKSEYFIDWGDGQTELFKSNTDDIPQDIIDSVQESESKLEEFLKLIDGSILSHTYNDKKEYTIKIYIYNPDLYKEYTLVEGDNFLNSCDNFLASYPNSVLLNLNCKPKLIKHYGINNKLFPVTFNAFNIECNPQLILDNEITEILDSSLGQYMFMGELKLPDNLTSIGDNAFNYCWGFTGELNIPSGVTSIGNYAFGNCSGFTGDLNIPDSVTSIGENAFYYCSGFTSLKLPKHLTNIGFEAFRYCLGFTGELNIPDSVTTIGESAFNRCIGFTSLKLPEHLTSIGDWAFYYCSAFTGELNIPKSITSIGDGTFSNCPGFTGELKLPLGITSIGEYAFNGCTGFTGELVIPQYVLTIGEDAFMECNFDIIKVSKNLEENNPNNLIESLPNTEIIYY